VSLKKRSENSQFLSESVNHSDQGVKQLLDAWNNKLTFPLSELGERYLRKDLCLVLYCSLNGKDIFNRKRFALTVCHDLLNDSGGAGGKREIRAGANNDQLTMLIESVHIVNDANWIIRSVGPEPVRLQIGNKFSHARFIHSLYLSLKTAQFFFVGDIANHWKPKDAFVQCSCGVIRENPNDVIQGRPQMVDDLSNQNTEAFRDDEVSMIVNRFLPSLVICIGEDWVFAEPEELQDFGVKVDDVLVGPF
jgi:hypothetical protein